MYVHISNKVSGLIRFIFNKAKRLISTIRQLYDYRGEFNNARARRALVDWYLSVFVMCKAWHQYNERSGIYFGVKSFTDG